MTTENNQPFLSLLDYIFVLRPMLFFPGWSTMLAGYFITDSDKWVTLYFSPERVDYFQLVLLLLGFGMLMGGSFILNQLADIKSDRLNNKLFIISDGHLSPQSALIETTVLLLFACLMASSLNTNVFLIFIMFFVITGWAYNLSPLKMKDRPWGSLAANALMGWLAFALGWSTVNDFSWHIITDSLPYLFFNTALYLFTTLPDLAGDESTAKNTLPVIFGIKPVIRFSLVLYIIGFTISVTRMDHTAMMFYLLSLPFFLKTVYSMKISDSIQTTKYGILLFALSICLKWPVYFLLMLAGFFSTKWYFRKRFNLDYPNFSGA